MSLLKLFSLLNLSINEMYVHCLIYIYNINWDTLIYCHCFYQFFKVIFQVFIYVFIFGWLGSSLLFTGSSLVARGRLLIAVASLAVEHNLWSTQAPAVAALGLSSLGSQVLEYRLNAVISGTWDQTSDPCVARWILNHWTAREALYHFFFILRLSVVYMFLFDMYYWIEYFLLCIHLSRHTRCLIFCLMANQSC